MRRIGEGLEACGVVPQLELTRHPGHATALAKDAAAAGYDAVIAVGGDGTVNEVVNGLAGTDTALGLIAAGTANLLAGELNLPSDITLACNVIAASRTKVIDLGVVDGRFFTMMAGVGFDARVVRLVDRKLKGRWGAFSYLIVLAREIMRYSFQPIHAVTEQGERLNGYYLFVQNATSYGSGFSASPQSQLDDGLLEIVVFPKKSLFLVVRYLLSAHKDSFPVLKRSIQGLQILSKHEIQIDGDYYCCGPCGIKIVPGGLRVLVP